MNVDELLQLLDETLQDSFTMPLIGRRVVDAGKLQGIIDDIRLHLPTEIRKAKMIVQDRADIVQDARREAENIIKQAEKRAGGITDDQEIVKRSEQKAAEILRAAQQESKEMRTSTREYCDHLLSTTEELMAKNMGELKTVRASLRGRGSKRGNVPPVKGE